MWLRVVWCSVVAVLMASCLFNKKSLDLFGTGPQRLHVWSLVVFGFLFLVLSSLQWGLRQNLCLHGVSI